MFYPSGARRGQQVWSCYGCLGYRSVNSRNSLALESLCGLALGSN